MAQREPFTTDNSKIGNDDVPDAQITIGTVQPDNQTYSYFLPDQYGIYTDYKIRSRFEKDGHIYMMPITRPVLTTNDDSVAFVQLAAASLLLIVDWTAARLNDQPTLPNPYPPTNSRWKLMDEQYEPFMLTVTGDGQTPLYRISGTYVYGCKNPQAVTVNDIEFSRPPWLLDNLNRLMPATKQVDGLIGQSIFKGSTGGGQKLT